MLRDAKRRLLYIGAAAAARPRRHPLPAPPPSPAGWRRSRASRPTNPPTPGSRSGRWTWDYVQDHPFGGGFEAYRQNRIQVQTVNAQTAGEVQIVAAQTEADEGRAYHSAYFEMLGEQGFPGLILFLLDPRHRPGPDGADPPPLPPRRGRGRLDRAARDRAPAFPAHLSGRRRCSSASPISRSSG